MLHPVFRMASWLIGGWLTALATIVVVSHVMGANRSTTALLVALGVAPGIVTALLSRHAPVQSVAEILYAAETSNDRS